MGDVRSVMDAAAVLDWISARDPEAVLEHGEMIGWVPAAFEAELGAARKQRAISARLAEALAAGAREGSHVVPPGLTSDMLFDFGELDGAEPARKMTRRETFAELTRLEGER